jgi:hypothetical protein
MQYWRMSLSSSWIPLRRDMRWPLIPTRHVFAAMGDCCFTASLIRAGAAAHRDLKAASEILSSISKIYDEARGADQTQKDKET